jgi:hypothetical protein
VAFILDTDHPLAFLDRVAAKEAADKADEQRRKGEALTQLVRSREERTAREAAFQAKRKAEKVINIIGLLSDASSS